MTLFTDLYELTMAQAYYAERMNDLAVFEDFSVRRKNAIERSNWAGPGAVISVTARSDAEGLHFSAKFRRSQDRQPWCTAVPNCVLLGTESAKHGYQSSCISDEFRYD